MKKISLILILFVGLFSACEKEFLETAPTNQISDADVFKTAAGAQTVLDGVLRKMRAYNTAHDDFGVKAIDLAWDLMGEDITCTRVHWFGYDYRLDNRGATYRRPRTSWSLFYQVINNVNNILVNADNISFESAEQEASIRGQAQALRGYAYYNLMLLFQFTYLGHESDPGVPVYLEPTTEGNPRSSVTEVYNRITTDLDDAIALMTANESTTRRHISDLTLDVVHGIRARVALEMGEWGLAESHAATARADYDLNNRDQFAAGFSSYSSAEWMWGLEINEEQSTIYASFPSHLDMSVGGYAGLGYSPKYMSEALYNMLPADDIRSELVTISGSGYHINYKFNAALAGKDFSADYVMMRPEEMLLIEAEAIARQGSRDTEVQALLDELHAVRQTAPVLVTATGTALLDLVLLERRFELWGEGFRGRDIKRLKIPLDRTGSNHNVTVCGTLYEDAEFLGFLYKIPQGEIDANNALTEADQNQ
ncbi:MAG: RagB/SusD family nutrient uptake outer membrane protein [Bacteroidales bacterium]|nr:RagB/SusD family nutrient uptake outer membrane protein [Bacteroidales bacterium]